MPVNDSIIVSQMLNMLSAILVPHVTTNEVLGQDAYKRIASYCMAWGFGGLCETNERQKLYAKMVEIFEATGSKECIPPCRGEATPPQSTLTRE